MGWKVRSLSRLSVLCVAALLAGDMTAGPTPSGTMGAPPAIVGDESAVLLRPQTRIRKLHLVRPDLIPYPLAYEVLC